MRLSHLHFAQTTNRSLYQDKYTIQYREWSTHATGALEIQVLLPCRINPPSASSAVVSMFPGSEPWLGSVKPWQGWSVSCSLNQQENTHESTSNLPLGYTINLYTRGEKCHCTRSTGRTQSRKILFLLCLCTELIDRVHHERRLYRCRWTVARINPGGKVIFWHLFFLELLRKAYRSISRMIRPYATLLTPAQPYPLIVGPSRPSFPISGRMSGLKSVFIAAAHLWIVKGQRRTLCPPLVEHSRHQVLLSNMTVWIMIVVSGTTDLAVFMSSVANTVSGMVNRCMHRRTG